MLLERRKDRPYTYTDIYLAFNIPKLVGNISKIQTLSSNLISGHEVISLASDTFYKYALNDTSASIQTTLIYKNTGNLTAQPSIGDLLTLLSTASCFLKLLPTSLLLDVYVLLKTSIQNSHLFFLDLYSIFYSSIQLSF
jgi:hypothetical protein